jgi:hypothetical protein
MAESAKSTTGGAAGNTAVPKHGDHDRVAMLSLKADGTPDQLNPEIIGDREFALDATREQFKQQAVSAVDQELRGVAAEPGAGESTVQDPAIAELQEAHERTAGQAEKAADATVGALFTDDPALSTSTEPAKPSTSR